ncbi:MAG TPA: BON domain-containing protein [Planctomycetaceae bacterium]|nr:BON domain-containing protein [Planctomycetaceae bacterium]
MNLQTLAEPSPDTLDAIARAIRLRTSGQIRDLHVDVLDGEVVLSGRTSTYYTKQLATHAVLDLVDDLALSNDIEVC